MSPTYRSNIHQHGIAILISFFLAATVLASNASADAVRGTQGSRLNSERAAHLAAAAGNKPSGQTPKFLAGTPWGDMGMTGPMFTGVMPVEQSGGQRILHLVNFNGERVDALSRDGSSRWRYQTLHATSLVGLEWLEYRCDIAPYCPARQYRIVDAVQDRSRSTMPAHPDNRDVWLYRVQSRPLDGLAATWRDVCSTGPDDTGLGLFVGGRWHSDGSWVPGGYTFSCTHGVIAKCVRTWGYKPWRTLHARDGRAVPLQPLHLACVRAARADYCGNGISYTRNGTVIDIRDVYGFNVAVPLDGFSREAGFDTHGSLFVAHERWPTGEQTDDSVVSLPTCQRPRRSLDRESERVLISVWSAESRP